MMSWHGEVVRRGYCDISDFFLRRFFRIAPAYYAAALFYYVITPPPAGLDLEQLVAWIGFLNDWHPKLTAWEVVPGGWSVSAEFSFYMIFPLVAARVTSQRRAVLFFAAVCLGTALVNTLGQDMMMRRYEPSLISNFMYFWAPNQAPVFAFGISLFFVLKALERPQMRSVRRYVRASTAVLTAAGLSIVASLTFLDLPKALTINTWRPSALMQASFGFALIILALAFARPGLFVNRWIAFVGKVSFSAYLTHFSIIQLVKGPLARVAGVDVYGYAAIGAFALGWVSVVAATIAFSTCTYHLIERPGIAFGRHVIALRRSLRVARPPTLVG
jgi:peptidoglycan/LPS O-acetylase OafA/YrhL